MSPDTREVETDLPPRPLAVCAALRFRSAASLFFDGAGGFDEAWGPRVAVEPTVVLASRGARRGAAADPVEELDRMVRTRRALGGPPGSGLAVLLGYELFEGPFRTSLPEDGLPDLVALAVDSSVAFPRGGRPVFASTLAPAAALDALERVRAAVERVPVAAIAAPRRGSGLRTSLPREAYLRAVETVRGHIRRGDIYQANLTQRFEVATDADPFDAYGALVAATPAPRSAFVETGSFALASASPETFLDVEPDGRIETRPIKGTRPRGTTPEDDAAAARALLDSAKDRAELLMIVDLERNDLSRACRAGTVRVPELAALRSYAAVHHLVARVEGRLKDASRTADLLRATFPGGSISGAPKERAIEVLRSLEPAPRSFYTGGLFWFGDDGRTESSVLIRSIVFTNDRALVGAGGGVVWDSEPEAEWRESCDKARAVLRVLGHEPEEAT